MARKQLQLRSFRNEFNRWVGVLPMECVPALRRGDDADWPAWEGSLLGIRTDPSGLKGVVTQVHAGAASWAMDPGACEAFFLLVACELAPAHQLGALDIDKASRVWRTCIQSCASNYLICPLPVDGEEWVEIPCQGRPLVVAAYALNPYAFRDLAIFRLSWGSEWWKEL